MKQFIISAILALLANAACFAQAGKKARAIAPLVLEENVRRIVVSGNINVVLAEDQPFNVGVKLPASSLEKISIRAEGESLFLTASPKLEAGERAEAYIMVSQLDLLELRGKVTVASLGILESPQLKVVINESAMVAIRSGGPVTVNSPASYQVVKEQNVYSVYAGDL